MELEKRRRRRQFRELEVVETLLLQGVEIICPDCDKPITMGDLRNRNVQKQHKHEFGLGGPDEPGNCYFSHAARPCHAQVTHGSPATFAGSSRHKVAKATDPERIEKFVINKPVLGLVQSVDPGSKCRGCGEYADACTCVKREPGSTFSRRRA